MPTVKRERAVRNSPSLTPEFRPYDDTTASESESPELEKVVESTSVTEPPTSSPPQLPLPPQPPRKFPYLSDNVLQPLLLVILNLSLSTAATALAAQYIGDEISALHADAPEEYWWYVVPGWKILKALGAWWGDYDTLDASLLTFLSLAPTTHFLATFHPSLSAYAHASTVAISTLSLTLPMYLLRSKASVSEHGHHHRHKSHKRRVQMDKSTYISTGLLASSIYASIMYTSLRTFLTRMVVSYFPSIGSRSGTGLVESVEMVYHPTAMFWGMAAPIGFAIAEVVLQKALKEVRDDDGNMNNQEAGAGVKGLLKKVWNWFTPRGKMVIKRTAWVGGYMGLDTLVRLAGVLKGGSVQGAGVVSGVWVAATAVTGLVFGWIGNE